MLLLMELTADFNKLCYFFFFFAMYVFDKNGLGKIPSVFKI